MSDKIIQLNEDLIKHDLKDLVRSSVEETLNALLDKEADELVNAEKYERSSERQGYRSGHYKRNLHTTAGEVELKVPKLKGIPFETAIIERYRRRESSVEEALIEMYLAGVSVRRVEDITEALWGTKVSPGTISSVSVQGDNTVDKGMISVFISVAAEARFRNACPPQAKKALHGSMTCPASWIISVSIPSLIQFFKYPVNQNDSISVLPSAAVDC